MTNAAHSVDPIWNIENGWIIPVAFPSDTALTKQIRHIIIRDNKTDVPIFLRGSMIEQVRPHPNADIDLLVVSHDKNPAISFRGLAHLNRFIDPQRIDPSLRDTVLTTLLWTRSIQLVGTPIAPKPVPITKDWIFAHWLRHGTNRLPNRLISQALRRVAETKQLIRTVGLIWLMKEGKFSRDLNTCVQWAKNINKVAGAELEEMLHNLAHPPYPPREITNIKGWLQMQFYEHWHAIP